MVDITIYDLLGRVVKNIIHEYQQTGYQNAFWDGTDNSGLLVASGIYIYKLSTDKFVNAKKMLFIK